jgi:hypothetical protein
MTPNRRQFVASLATMPILLEPTFAEQAGPAPPKSDPVIDKIAADLRELAAEFESQPAIRKQTMRGMEVALGLQAVHVGAHYDAELRRSLRAREARIGRAALIQEILAFSHDRKQHEVSFQAIDAALTRLAQRGISGAVRDVADTIRKIRLNAPDPVQQATARGVQFDYCSDLRWQIEMMTAMAATVCGVAGLEPGPFFEAACASMTLALGLLLLQQWWYC